MAAVSFLTSLTASSGAIYPSSPLSFGLASSSLSVLLEYFLRPCFLEGGETYERGIRCRRDWYIQTYESKNKHSTSLSSSMDNQAHPVLSIRGFHP